MKTMKFPFLPKVFRVSRDLFPLALTAWKELHNAPTINRLEKNQHEINHKFGSLFKRMNLVLYVAFFLLLYNLIVTGIVLYFFFYQ